MIKTLSCCVLVALCSMAYSQVDTAFIYNTSMPYGTLDLRLAKSSSRYYYLQPDKTISFRENNGSKTNTYRNMTSWDSSPYTEGNLRERNGSSDYFVMNYRLLFPNNYNKTYQPGYPLIIMLHGVGERGNCWDSKCYHADRSWNVQSNNPPAPTDETHRLLNNDHNLLHGGKVHLDARNAAGTRLPNDPSMPGRAFPGFVLFPQNMNGWSVNTVQDAIRLVRLVAKTYNVDPNRIYLHGLSNGGYATYEALKRAPWLFAAALPMSAVTDAGILTHNQLERVAHIPLWIFQGGKDTAPTPSRTEGYIRKFREGGMNVRYSLYPNLGHGVWNTAYREADFFKWMLQQNKTKLHVFAGNPAICKTNGKGVRLELAPGFHRYQWERNGVIISGANSHAYVATTPGTYRARFSRVANPTASQWNAWSATVTVTEQNPAQAKAEQIGTLHLRDLNNGADARLKAVSEAAHYYWYKDGALVDLPGTQDDTIRNPVFKQGNCNSNCTGNGKYTLVTAGYDNCPSPPSAPMTIFFNNQSPINITAPGNAAGATASSSSIRLTWSDASSNESGFEIWRKKANETTWVMATLTNANATSFTDTKLEPNMTYHYKIRAVSATGRSNYTPSAATSFIVASTGSDTVAPTAPTNLAAQQSGINTITLTWRASTDNTGIREYVIYYGTRTVETKSTATTYTLTNLAVNTNYSFTVKAKDLAGNLSVASNAATANTTVSGLYYEHSTGAWSSLDAINWNVVEYKGTVKNFTLAPRTQEDYFNFKFDGYLYIKTAGSYEFRTISSDGSRVELDGVIVVDNNGLHDNKTVTGPARSLTAGAKRIVVKYFEYDGVHSLTVRYRGPDTNGSWVNVPDGALRSTLTTSSSTDDVEIDEDRSNLAFTVYPNPASPRNLNVQLLDDDVTPGVVSILDIQGRVYYQHAYDAEQLQEGVQIDPTLSLNNGMYLLVVRQKNRVQKKLISIMN